MEINQLLEGSNNFKTLQADAARLADKWTQSGLLEGYSNEIEKNNMAMILENQAKQIVAEQSSTGTGTSRAVTGGGENWAGVALPLVRKVFAQIAAKDFVSVQPMNLPSGLVFYLDFKYGTGTNGRTAGANMYGNVSTADAKIGSDVDPSGGLYGAGSFGYSINQETSSYDALTTAALTSADSASVYYDVDVDAATFTKVSFATSGISGYDSKGIRAFRILSGSTVIPVAAEYTKVNGSNLELLVLDADISGVDSGSLVYHKQPADNSRGDFEDNPAGSITIPEINVELASEAIVAKTRKLKAQWTPEFAQDLNAYHSIDA